MKLPKKIRFLGIDYTVEFVDKLDHEDNWGRTSYKTNTIRIEEELDPQRQEEVFIHELFHLACNATGIEWNRKQEEQFVDTIGKNMYGILKDNNLLKLE